MKQLYLKPYMTIFCITEDVLTESVEKQIRYNCTPSMWTRTERFM